jgi:hypothetical protein
MQKYVHVSSKAKAFFRNAFLEPEKLKNRPHDVMH